MSTPLPVLLYHRSVAKEKCVMSIHQTEDIKIDQNASFAPASQQTDASSIYVIVPAYNEGPVIRDTLTPLLSLGYTVVLVDDGSQDNTCERVSGLPIHLLRHPINLGQGAALQTGMDYVLSLGARAVVHFDADAMILVTRFVEGKTLTAEMARKSGALERIIATVKRYHEGPAFPGLFSPFETVRAYHRLALDHDVAFPAEIDDAFARMDDIETALARVTTRKPCHNDLLAGNFIDDGERIWVVDWEYAGMGDPYFDLGNFAVNQELDDSGCETVVRLYTRETRDADLAHLHLMRVASDLRESFWGFLQSGISTLDFDYVDYAKKHLERFLDNASKARFNANLRAVSK